MALIGARFGYICEPTGHSWTERVYLSSAVNIAAAVKPISDLAKLRVMLLGGGVRLKSIVLSDDLVFRDALPVDVPSPIHGNPVIYNKEFDVSLSSKDTGAGHDELDYADFPYSCLLLRKRSGNLYSGSWSLSGSPDLDQAIIDQKPQDPLYQKYFDPWKALMISGPFGMKVQSRENDNPAKPIIGFAGASMGLVNVAAHGFANLSKVRITGVKYKDGDNPNGTWTVIVPDADHFVIRGYNSPTTEYIDGGTARAVKPIIVPIEGLDVKGFSSHKRGSSLFKRRGRAKTRK